jgi:hypothetical protein
MGRQTVLEADLDFSVDLPGDRLVTGRLTGSGSRLDLSVSDPFVFAGRGDSTAIGHLADALASRGLSVTVTSPAGPLVTLGAARTPWWQRRVTGSRHIRIERGAGLWSLARGRVRAAPSALPSSDLAPPATLWPPAPTLVRRPRPVTTTHDPLGGGNPRMIMAPRSDPWPGDRQQVFGLRKDVTSIGSDAGCDIQLPGLDPRHAEVRHDERDEYVVVGLGRFGDTLVNGEPVESSLLRTATRLQVGAWTMSFYREEYADHGRPYGGRVGGEIGHQRPQPPPRHRPASSWSQGDRR